MIKEKIYTRVGPEFGNRAFSMALITRALYGLITSAERSRTLLEDYLHFLGFILLRYDHDVWMRLRDTKTSYEYICTHVDNFQIIAKDADSWLQKISHTFLVKSHGLCSYYLGNDSKYHEDLDVWNYGGSIYTKDAIGRVERIYGFLLRVSTPSGSRITT